MTAKFLDYKICTFKILLSWRFPQKKTLFLDDFPLCPQGPPPLLSWHFPQKKTPFLDDFPLCPQGPPLKSENIISRCP